ARRPREHALKGFQPFSAQAVAAGEMKEVAVKAHYKGELAAAQPHRALGNHVEHRLDISWRATDNVEHLAGRGPVFKSLRQLLRPSLHLVEQPRVLDRDHRLVGEGCSELDLFLGECPYLGATDTETPDSLVRSQQGNGEGGPESHPERHRVPFRELLALDRKIMHVNRFAIHHRASIHPGSRNWPFDKI